MFKTAGSCPCPGAPSGSASTGAGNARRSCGVSSGATGGTTSGGGGVPGCRHQAQRLICPGLCLKIVTCNLCIFWVKFVSNFSNWLDRDDGFRLLFICGSTRIRMMSAFFWVQILSP
jgi:hypothetical protein